MLDFQTDARFVRWQTGHMVLTQYFHLNWKKQQKTLKTVRQTDDKSDTWNGGLTVEATVDMRDLFSSLHPVTL